MENTSPIQIGKSRFTKINFVGCGGYGKKMIRRLQDTLSGMKFNDHSLEDSIHFGVIDTSANDVPEFATSLQISLPQEGSGKDRAVNYPAITLHLKNAFHSEQALFRPFGKGETVLTVLLFSLCGGSGSVIGPLVLNQILSGEIEQPVIVAADACIESMTDANNAAATFKTLKAISQQRKVCLPVLGMTRRCSHQTADKLLLDQLKLVSTVLLSSTRDFDESDIKVFFNPAKVKVSPSLVCLKTQSSKDLKEVTQPRTPNFTPEAVEPIVAYTKLALLNPNGSLDSFGGQSVAVISKTGESIEAANADLPIVLYTVKDDEIDNRVNGDCKSVKEKFANLFKSSDEEEAIETDENGMVF